MLIAVTGATGFLGRYLVNHLTAKGHRCRCWYRPESSRGGFHHEQQIEWLPGELNQEEPVKTLVRGTDAVVHAALARGANRQDVGALWQLNLFGSLQLMAAARHADVPRFIFISSCAVHDVILDDRPLNEAHPLWPKSHYGAHKAAIEKFVHSYGLGEGWPICSLRPTGIYGLATPFQRARWLNIVQAVMAHEPIQSSAGGKEVHAEDVARAVELLLNAPAEQIAGQAFNCCDRYIAEQDVAQIAKKMIGSNSRIEMLNKGPKHQIDTTKLRELGMQFGGDALLHETIQQMIRGLESGVSP